MITFLVALAVIAVFGAAFYLLVIELIHLTDEYGLRDKKIIAPIGTITEEELSKMLGGKWLPCDGRKVTIEDYPELFRHLDALGTHSLPDLRDCHDLSGKELNMVVRAE